MNKILIGALSAWKFHKRRRRCTDTWLADLKHGRDTSRSEVDGVLLLGSIQALEPERHGDWLILPCPDSYQFLPQRTRMFCQWALRFPWWTHVFKMDDDTRLDVQRLVEYDTQGADYIGHPVEEREDSGYMTDGRELTAEMKIYGSGNGYLLSRKAAQIVADKLTDWEGSEDTQVGAILRQEKIFLRPERKRFRVCMQLGEEPGLGNDWVYASPSSREDI